MASGVDVAQVARVVVGLPDDKCRVGSGYRISERLVLTAKHVLKDGEGVLVRLGGEEFDRPTAEVWQDTDLDVALLSLDTSPTACADPVLLGRVDRARNAEVTTHAVGFPGWAVIDRSSPDAPDDIWRGSTTVRCRILTSDVGSPDTLRVVVDDAPDVLAAPGRGTSLWQGMSGAALISDTGLLVGIIKEHVPAAGIGRLEVTPLDRVDDEGWRDALRGEHVDPRPLPVLPDNWSRTDGLHQHHSRYAVVRNMASHALVKERLPYVDPGDSSSPGKILARLADLAKRPGLPAGLNIDGAAGAGKSRLCLEVAGLAHESRDWLVVHVSQSAPLRDVWDSIRGLAGQVLVVADEIDWIADPGTTYSSVFSEAEGRGVRLAVLTTVRRGRLEDEALRPLDPRTTFETVHVREDPEYHRAITRQIVQSLAPAAVEQTDDRYMKERCAGPPAVSRFYATLLNHKARAGEDVRKVAPSPDSDFGSWLNAILIDMGLPLLGDDVPDRAATAVALTVAHSPCRLEDALDFFAPEADDPRREEGGRLLGKLLDNGLLAFRNHALRPVHDVYADHLLGVAVLKKGQNSVHRVGLRRVLDSGLADGSALASVAVAVDRLRDKLDEEAVDALTGVVDDWCVAHRAVVRDLVVAADAKGDGRELRALLLRETWRPVVLREFAEPWLREHYAKARARNTILAVASQLPDSDRYLSEWIYIHGERPSAARALHKALASGLDTGNREWTTDQAHEWLTRHPLTIDASFPLQRLLDTRLDVLPRGNARMNQVRNWALRWLRRYGTTGQAGYVAGPLLKHPELTGADLERTARLLLDTVAPGDPSAATFALVAVLSRHRLFRDLPEDLYGQAVRDSFAWLNHEAGYGLRPSAAYLLRELIVPGLPGRDGLPRAVQAAWNWLNVNGGRHVEMGLLLPPLLKNAVKTSARDNAALTEDEQQRLAVVTMDWLAADDGSTGLSVSEVTGALLSTRLPDEDPERLRWLADRALALLRDRPGPSVARSVLTPLLHRTNLGTDTRDRVLVATFDQLAAAPDSPHLAYPLTSLLRRSDLTGDEPARMMAATLHCLDKNPRAPGALGMLTTALNSPLAKPADRAQLAARSVRVLSLKALVPEKNRKKPSLVRALWNHRAENSPEWNRFVARACDLLKNARYPKRAEPALEDLLKGSEQLDAPVLDRLCTACVDWSAVNDHDNRSIQLLAQVLNIRDSSPRVRRRATEVARQRFRTGGEQNVRDAANGRLLEALLSGGDFPDGEAIEQVLDVALNWLALQSNRQAAVGPLLVQVAHSLEHSPRRPEAERRTRRALDLSDAWLRDRPDDNSERRQQVEGHRRRLAALLGVDDSD
ncbi:trypsin-like peptidase domain-containing protein [Streptomyces sp. NPDC050255]|uniref:trypsin-like peptidase domain-containing protein n=1 Tax=Streptomyces sp. NPDC050255 TaxID=3365606 RepID=UPI0037B65DD0